MPRRAPDGKGVTEQRVTLGTFERNLLTEAKTEVAEATKYRTTSIIAVPAITAIGSLIGFGLLGYGIYRGLDAFQEHAAETVPEIVDKAKQTGKDVLSVGSEPGSPFIILNPLGPFFKAYFQAKERDII